MNNNSIFIWYSDCLLRFGYCHTCEIPFQVKKNYLATPLIATGTLWQLMTIITEPFLTPTLSTFPAGENLRCPEEIHNSRQNVHLVRLRMKIGGRLGLRLKVPAKEVACRELDPFRSFNCIKVTLGDCMPTYPVLIVARWEMHWRRKRGLPFL